MSVAKWSLVFLLGLLTSFGRCEESKATLGIEPLANALPANFLKFYLHFTEPMERGDVFRYLRLLYLNDDGKEQKVLEPFREVELWSADFKTLTLWLHPGRQKPGVNLNVELGPILAEGSRYRLVVSPEWKTQSGGKLIGELEKSFRAGPSDKEQPDPGGWQISRKSETKLVVDADGALDPASLRKRLRVVSESGNTDIVFGSVILGRRVTLDLRQDPQLNDFNFKSWAPGRYRIEIDPSLEDLAGNSVARPFNLDLEKHPDFVEKAELIKIAFRITESHEVEITSP